MKGALLAADGAVRARRRGATRASEGSDAVLDRAAAILAELRAEAAVLGTAAPLVAGVAVPGIVEETTGIARFAANLPWRDLPVASRLGEALSLPVLLSHDVRAAGLAEARLGAARGVSEFLLLAIGTGVAGAVFTGGRPVAGRHGRAGELGHLVVEQEGELCGCGQRGCLETVASAAGIARSFAQRRGPAAAAAVGRESRASARDVFELASGGDTDAVAVRDRAVNALAGVLAGYQLVLDAELVVVGGGLSLLGPLLLEPLQAALAERCELAVVPELRPAQLGAEAGCVGAGLVALEASGGALAPVAGRAGRTAR